ncbi:MAG: N-acetyltransferase [Ignavibacteriales bacterium]|nr:MAG: N-acetyltransferase [Ignavibacteriales bacterium]
MIYINNDIYLSHIKKEDKPSLIKYINDIDIYKNTLKIPFPYTERDADNWIARVELLRSETGVQKHWGIKNKEGELIGGIGFNNKYGSDSHKDEIGYWLGKPFWNRGIMTKVINKICTIGFKDLNLVRIEANVFSSNVSSKKVLIKTGFVFEGTLHKYCIKDNNYIDADIFALIR